MDFLFGADERRGFGFGIGVGILLPEQVGKRLEAFFLRHRGAGALFRTEGQVEILQGREVFGGVDFDLQFLGEELAFLE